MKFSLNNLMKSNVKNAPFMEKFCKTASNMYRMGWDERNGGNMSLIIDEEEAEKYLDLEESMRDIPLTFDAKPLAGRIMLVTGTGKYFKNVEDDPENNLGIIRISEDGTVAKLLWGWEDGGKFTSELPTHCMTHIE